MAGDDWITTPIESLIRDGIIVGHKDGNYGSSYPRVHNFGDEGVPFITAKLLDDAGNIDFDSAPRLAWDIADRLTYGFIEAGDVLLSHNATIGRVAVVPVLPERVLVGTSLTYFRVDRSRLLPRYLAAYFSGCEFQNQLNAVMSHSTRNQVPITAQRKLNVVVPPLSEQAKIVSYLGPLDDKIELNRRMNRTLEQMAAAIFKAWFVDFEPVKAKADGAKSFPSMPHEVFDALPTEFTDSPLGPIPKEWSVVGFGDVAVCFDSKRIPLSKRERAKRQGSYPYYGAASVMDHVDDFLFDGIYVLMGEDGSVITDDGHPVLQYVWGQFWVNNHAHVLQGKNGVSTEHLLLSLRQSILTPFITGAVQLKLNQGNMNQIPFVLPSSSVSEAFARTIDPLFAKYRASVEESRTLAAIRDALLPKLLSGEIRVGGNARAVEGVA